MTSTRLLNPEPGEPSNPRVDETVIDDAALKPEAANFQIMPPLSDEDNAALEKSIAENGVLTPIVVDEFDNIIDGHHRQQIATKLGKFCPRRTVRDLTDAQKIAMTLTLNVDRRHLTSAQKRELLARSIKASPELSDPQIIRYVHRPVDRPPVQHQHIVGGCPGPAWLACTSLPRLAG